MRLSSVLGTERERVFPPRHPLPLPIPRLLKHPSVRPVELEFDLGAVLGELADVAALLAARPLDLAVDARKLELQALGLEHGRVGLLASGFHDELSEQALPLPSSAVVRTRIATRRLSIA